MHVFLTGATGFIGSRIVPELLAAGHSVLGLTRSEAGARALAEAGATPHLGTLEDPDSLRAGAAQAEAVIHCAFDHDFSRFVDNCEKDRRVIRALGAALAGGDRPLLITSGTGIGAPDHGRLATEDVFNPHHPNPRIASEEAGAEMLAAGVKVVTVRLPQVHNPERQGLVSPYVMIARQKGAAGYIGEGRNRWAAAHVTDVVRLYRLALEQGKAGERFHAVDEEGVSARDIAEAVAAGLGAPAVSLTPEQAGAHFGWLAPFMGLDMPASSAWTRQRLGWRPTGPGLIADLKAMDYSAFG
jgi:nucleoside-diphosphate-sugar epimerase